MHTSRCREWAKHPHWTGAILSRSNVIATQLLFHMFHNSQKRSNIWCGLEVDWIPVFFSSTTQIHPKCWSGHRGWYPLVRYITWALCRSAAVTLRHQPSRTPRKSSTNSASSAQGCGGRKRQICCPPSAWHANGHFRDRFMGGTYHIQGLLFRAM